MTATTKPSRVRRVRRFEPSVRLVHRTLAILMTVCVVTAGFLYIPQLEVIGGHRYLIEQVHVYSGFALPVPILLGLLSRAYRGDLRMLNRFAPTDWKWLRSRKRRDGSIAVGKFNAGQKLNGSLSAGSIGVLLFTGTLMFFTHLVRLSFRTGATFVHDWVALALGLLLMGHFWHASRDTDSREGMRTGDVRVKWAQKNHAAWLAEIEREPLDPAPSHGHPQPENSLGIAVLGEVPEPGA